MSKQLRIMVGVAMLATLALGGMLSIFTFGVTQPVEAQAAVPTATRSFSPTTVAPDGDVTVTIAFADIGGFGFVTEMLPAGFTYVSSSLPDDDVDATTDMTAPRFTLLGGDSFTYTVTAPTTEGDHTFSGTLRGGVPPTNYPVGGDTMVTVAAVSADATLSDLSLWNGSVEVTISPAFAAGTTDYTASVANSVTSVTVTATPTHDAAVVAGDGDNSLTVGANTITITVTAEDGTTTETYTVTVTRAAPGVTPTTPDPDKVVVVSNASVTARPDDPGALTQITVKFKISEFLAIDESITLEVSDDLGVPSSISASNVSISGQAAVSADAAAVPETASPRSVIVETDAVAERYVITLNIGNMDDSADRTTDKGLAAGDVTVTFRQEAGITNRTEGGEDKWFFKTTQEDLDHQIFEDGDGDEDNDDVYNVPFTISLSSYKDSRGEQITAIGKGFKNGTTTRFWRDQNNDGSLDSDETVLCDQVADGDDIAECTFTLFSPPFKPGFGTAANMNYVNAIDGRGNTATKPLKKIELEPSISVSPKRGIPGDSINIQLHDFQTDDKVTRIEFARTVDICDSVLDNDIPTCQSIGATGMVGDNGTLSFSFDIPTTVTPGAQDLQVHTTNGKDNTTFIVGSGELQLSATNVLPNQRISVSGSGFTKSANQNPAFIGEPDKADSCPRDADDKLPSIGTVTLDGDQIDWRRVNDGDGIEVTSGGTWSAPIDLPVSASTTSAGIREFKITDCLGGVATIDLTFAEREVTMTPAEGGVGTEVVISGKNYPVRNDDGSDVDVEVVYDADVDTDDDDVEPDALGNFTVILEVPEDAGIPSNNTVSVRFFEDARGSDSDDDRSEVLDTFTHRVPQGTVAFSAVTGAEGSVLTINANGFARYTRVDLVEFGDREITPTPNPSTDTSGNAEFSVRIPGSDPGIYIIRVEIDDVVATSTFTVVSGSGASDATVETVLANLISEGALDRIFRFDNADKTWEWYIADPSFSASNNLAGLSAGDLVFIKVTQDVTADILGASIALTCINEGTETEDCWNTITIP